MAGPEVYLSVRPVLPHINDRWLSETWHVTPADAGLHPMPRRGRLRKQRGLKLRGFAFANAGIPSSEAVEVAHTRESAPGDGS